ncbi:MAG TPA: septation protein A [Hyphomicrobiaceae bacterium]|nr:septation protein A [Hyphomicrobiaceae bacterium]
MTEGPAAHRSEAELGTNQLLKLLLEMGPLGVFFLVNSYKGIFWGTGAFMLATLVSLTTSRALLGRVPIMPMVSGVFVMVFGGLTLLLQDELFIKMKPTIVNTLFASILFAGLWCGHSLLKVLFGEVFRLREPGWRLLTFRWACFFAALALLNEMVWRSFSTDFWVAFKVFGIMPLTLAFAVSQIGLLKRYGESSGH